MEQSERSDRLESMCAIGWEPAFEQALQQCDPTGELQPARVSREHRGAYDVLAGRAELQARISGRLEYLAAGPEDYPAVGDWVAASLRPSEGAATIHHVLPRRTALVRKVADRAARAQVLAANLDVVLVVTSANRNFNRRRVERMLALVAESGAEARLVLSKADLCDDVGSLVSTACTSAAGVRVFAVSSWTGQGVEEVAAGIRGRTAALIGSSGVGKSSLANRILGREELATREIRDTDDKGRHATTHRQLIAVDRGGVLIDTPGLREIGLWDDEGGVASAFPDVEALAAECRFHDCQHGGEPGCAVEAALADGRLEPERLESWAKLAREAAAVRRKRDAQARHEHRKHQKRFAKMLRSRPDKRRYD